MENTNEIKDKLNILYREYKDKNSKLNDTKKRKAAHLLINLTNTDGIEYIDIAKELSRFSYEVSKYYFDSLTLTMKLPIETLDELLMAFMSTNNDPSKSQHFVKKFIESTIVIMRNYGEKALSSLKLPELVAFAAGFAVNTPKMYKDSFQRLINQTDGKIYLLDYTKLSDKKLSQIWKITNILYPNLNESKYNNLISDWAKKYGFVTKSEEENISEAAPVNEKAAEKAPESIDHGAVAENYVCTIVEKLYGNIQKDLAAERNTIVSSISAAVAPLTYAVSSFRAEIGDIQRLSNENKQLDDKNTELKNEIDILKKTIQSVKAENDELSNLKSELERKNSELDAKLGEAYAINSREASLEAQKIRADLTKALKFLYEDWLEYEFSDYSEANFESLQAIIKKIFRTLERNGIDFKENS